MKQKFGPKMWLKQIDNDDAVLPNGSPKD